MRAVNLLPRDEPRRKQDRLSLQAQLTIAAPVVVAALLGALWLFTSTRVKDDRATLRALRDELAALPAPKPQAPVDPVLKAQHDQRVAALAAALAQRVAWDRILRQISSILPEDVWLTGIDARSSAATPIAPAPAPTEPTSTDLGSAASSPPPPPAAASGNPLVIDGYTYSQEGVARFLARLSVIPDLMNVELKTSALTEVAGRRIVQFTIDAALRPPGTA